MRTCRDCMNLFYPEEEFDHQDLCSTCRNDEVVIAIAGPVDLPDTNIFSMDRGKLQKLAYERGERIAELEAELSATHKYYSGESND